MPYIKSYFRTTLSLPLKSLVKELKHMYAPCHGMDCVAGFINYVITYIIKALWAFDPSYQTANAIVGALECAKQEFIRRTLNPYEDRKIEENGDVIIEE